MDSETRVTEQGISYIMDNYGKHEDQADTIRQAAMQFMSSCGLEPTSDSLDQLTLAFLPALRIMCERGYDPNGQTWKRKGWRGLVCDILNKAGRLKFHSWTNNDFDPDSAADIINFAGFYYRMQNEGAPWGEWGEPAGWEVME